MADVTGGQPLGICGSRLAPDISAAVVSAVGIPRHQSATPVDNHRDKPRE